MVTWVAKQTSLKEIFMTACVHRLLGDTQVCVCLCRTSHRPPRNARIIDLLRCPSGHIATPRQHPSPWWNAHPSPSEPFGELDGHRRAPLDFCNFFGYERIATDTPLAVIGPLTKSFPNDIISGISHFLFHSLS